MTAQADHLRAEGRVEQADNLVLEVERMTGRHGLSHSFAGRLGHLIEPAIRPLGFDWQIGVGVISSFAAREVIVSTLAIVYGVGDNGIDEQPRPLYEKLRAATRSDGTAVFSTATCVSMLVFYVLAMQCLPTLATTRRETKSWRWPAFQLGYMTVLAYVSALVCYQVLTAIGLS